MFSYAPPSPSSSVLEYPPPHPDPLPQGERGHCRNPLALGERGLFWSFLTLNVEHRTLNGFYSYELVFISYFFTLYHMLRSDMPRSRAAFACEPWHFLSASVIMLLSSSEMASSSVTSE